MCQEDINVSSEAGFLLSGGSLRPNQEREQEPKYDFGKILGGVALESTSCPPQWPLELSVSSVVLLCCEQEQLFASDLGDDRAKA